MGFFNVKITVSASKNVSAEMSQIDLSIAVCPLFSRISRL